MITVGVLALQGAFVEHINLLTKAAAHLSTSFEFTQVRNAQDLAEAHALVIPGGESTTMALVAKRLNLLDPLHAFVNTHKRPTWGTCAGLILLAEEASATKKGGQDLLGGLDIRVHRNHFGRQMESFETDLDLPFLSSPSNTTPSDGQPTVTTPAPPFHAIFIRAPVVEAILPAKPGRGDVEILAALSGDDGAQDTSNAVVAVRQGNVFGTSFHPELTLDERIHLWWLRQVEAALAPEGIRQT